MLSTSPTSSAATKAPRIEPMPPMTTTTNARISIGSPIPTCTASSGAVIIPAKPASAAPRAKVSENSIPIFTPRPCTIRRLAAPARMSMPMRVCATRR